MKMRLSLFVILLVIVGVGLMLWRRTQREATPPSTTAVAEQKRAESVTQSSGAAQPEAVTPPSAEKLSPQEQRRQAINTWEQAREKEVEFWGRVIDQNDEPVPGVSVTATITTHQIPSADVKPQPTPIYSVSSDSSGLFHFKGRAGRGFTIETMKKTGYVLPPALQNRTNNLFWYNYDQLDPKGFKADGDSPVLFRMWKIGLPDKLIAGEGFYGIVPDGRIYSIDLLSKAKLEGTSGGDLRVRIRRPESINLGDRGYDWSFEIEGQGGGLILTQDEFMYSAPANGYQSAYGLKFTANDEHWTDQVERRFFLQSRDGKVYARLVVEVFANYRDKAVFSVKYFANPNGSRNLEYDPLQNVAKPTPAAKP